MHHKAFTSPAPHAQTHTHACAHTNTLSLSLAHVQKKKWGFSQAQFILAPTANRSQVVMLSRKAKKLSHCSYSLCVSSSWMCLIKSSTADGLSKNCVLPLWVSSNFAGNRIPFFIPMLLGASAARHQKLCVSCESQPLGGDKTELLCLCRISASCFGPHSEPSSYLCRS